MKRLWPWIAATVVLAAALHLALVAATPRLVNALWLSRLSAAGVPINQISHAKRPKPAVRDIVGYDNPDNLSSFMIYDLSRGPVRIHARAVREAAYWSICFVDADTNVFGLVRDQDVSGDAVDIVLVRRGQTHAVEPGERVLASPTDRGVALFRTIMPDRYDPKAVAQLAAVNAESQAEPAQ
jgi:uncharacterized membrane protein